MGRHWKMTLTTWMPLYFATTRPADHSQRQEWRPGNMREKRRRVLNLHGCDCWAVEYLNADDTLGIVVRVFGVIEMSIVGSYLCEAYWVCE